MTHIITNGETTNGETKTDDPYRPSLDRIEDKLTYFLGKLVENYVNKAVVAKLQAVVLVTNQLEAELDEMKANDYVDLNGVEDHLKLRGIDELMDRDEVRELITEMDSERNGEQDDAVDSSAYAKIEDVESTVRDHVEKYDLINSDSARELIRDFINNEVSVSIDDATFSIEA